MPTTRRQRTEEQKHRRWYKVKMATTNLFKKDRNRKEVSAVIVHGSYGQEPWEHLKENKHTAIFDIYNFADLPQKRTKWITTTSVEVSGHQMRLVIFPRGSSQSNADVEHVSIFLLNGGEKNTPAVNIRHRFRTKTKDCGESPHWNNNFTTMTTTGRGINNFKKREDMILEDLDSNGTLTIEVDIMIGTKKRNKIWFPQVDPPSKNALGPRLYRSKDDTSDVSFRVGSSMVESKAHANVLAVSAPVLYELISDTTSGRTTQDDEDIVLQDINPVAFEMMMEFIYTNKVPDLKHYTNKNDDNDGGVEDEGNDDDEDEDDDDDKEETGDELMAKSIITVADRFGCTSLKLYSESCIVQDILRPSNAARLLLFADSHSCALLKEACMNLSVVDPESVMDSNPADWKLLKASNDVFEELLLYPRRRKHYFPWLDHEDVTMNYFPWLNHEDGTWTINDADPYDVTSLRERLEKYHLDTDGSREMLFQRWTEYVAKLKSQYEQELQAAADQPLPEDDDDEF